MDKRWIYKYLPPQNEIEQLAAVINISEALATLLLQRGIHTFEKAKSFFRPSLDELHNPFLMKNMDKAVLRIEQSITEKEKVLIYGDYDVDGTTAVALVYGFLHTYHPFLDFYIPDRQQEGYGISRQSIDWASQEGFSLIIALDCGIKSVELTRYANSLNIDLIICDHHLPGNHVPEAIAVLDPKQADCPYPFKELSGCGIGFKLMQAFSLQNHLDLERLYDFLDLVVVSIASDLVQIVGENRILAYYGLQKLNYTPRTGLKALLDIAGFKGDSLLNIGNLVFNIGPRINAVGRLKHAKEAVLLLLSHKKEQADYFAGLINELNSERKNLDAGITTEALEMIALEKNSGLQLKSTVLYKSDWHKGVLGIVAARCIEKHHRPTIILSENKGTLSGSGRSVPGFDLHKALESCADLLTQFGGHQQAAGLSLHLNNFEAFKNKFEQIVSDTISEEQLYPLIEVDLKLKLNQINAGFYKILKQLAPFGPQNMRPVFVSENLKIENIRILKEKHLKFNIKEENSKNYFEVIAFGMADKYESLVRAKSINLCYVIEENTYQGKTSLQLRMNDMKANF